MRAVIESRLSHLSPEALRLAQAGAVLGEPAVFEELQHTAGFGNGERPCGVRGTAPDRAPAGRGRERGEARYALSHDRVRETLMALLSPERRRLLHERAARSPGRSAHGDGRRTRGAASPAPGGGREMASGQLSSYRQAGEWALRSAAPRNAAALLERALALTPATREHQEVRVELLVRIAQALDSFDAGNLVEWRRTGGQRLTGPGLQTCPARSARRSARFPASFPARGSTQQRRRWLLGRWTSPRQEGTKRDVAKALYQKGRITVYQGGETAAVEAFEEALALASEAGDDSLTATLHSFLARVLMVGQRRDLDGARQHLEAAMSIRRRMGQYEGLFEIVGGFAFSEVMQGNYAAASRWMEEVLEAALREGRRLELVHIYGALGWFAQLGNDDAAAVHHFKARPRDRPQVWGRG